MTLNMSDMDCMIRENSNPEGGFCSSDLFLNDKARSICVSRLVIFGGTGDLSVKKLIPALIRLHSGSYLPDSLVIVITGRRNMSDNEFKNFLNDTLASKRKTDSCFLKAMDELLEKISYVPLDPTDSDSVEHFLKTLQQIDMPGISPSCLFYMALPPEHFADFLPVVGKFMRNNDAETCVSRLIIEKPFGNDLKSARELNSALRKIAGEDRILRIDHYLGKEAVQNIMIMRFANLMFETLWDRKFIDHVQISFSETQGVGRRGAYFDNAGILKDVVQNHLLQVLCMIAMEPPGSGNADVIREEKVKVLKSLRPISEKQCRTHTVRAQYGSLGSVGEPGHIPAYLEEYAVIPGSRTETYAALKVNIDNWRWEGVPFYLRAGKRLSASATEIAVFFKRIPFSMFPHDSGICSPNKLTIRVQPAEGIKMTFNTKLPGMKLKIAQAEMNFSYDSAFSEYRPDAYERLLLDALHGDTSLFLGNGEIENAWRFVDPIIDAWKNDETPLPSYAPYSEGPAEADNLPAVDGKTWLPLCADCR